MKKLVIATALAALVSGPAFALDLEIPKDVGKPAESTNPAYVPEKAAKPESTPPAAVEAKPADTPKGEAAAAAASPEKSMTDIFSEAGIDPRCTARDPVWFDSLDGCASLPK